MLTISAIAAMNSRRVIGDKGALPWHLPEDLKRFSALTRGHAVLMGRKTWDSLPAKFKPLPGRINIVCSQQPRPTGLAEGVHWISNIEEYLARVRQDESLIPSGHLWVIGGEQVYRLTQKHWDEVYLTLVHQDGPGDALFPEFESEFQRVALEPGQGFDFTTWKRSP